MWRGFRGSRVSGVRVVFMFAVEVEQPESYACNHQPSEYSGAAHVLPLARFSAHLWV